MCPITQGALEEKEQELRSARDEAWMARRQQLQEMKKNNDKNKHKKPSIHEQLIEASASGNLDEVKALVAHGADVNYQSLDACKYKSTPLIAAAKWLQLEVALACRTRSRLRSVRQLSKNSFTLRCDSDRSELKFSKAFSRRARDGSRLYRRQTRIS